MGLDEQGARPSGALCGHAGRLTRLPAFWSDAAAARWCSFGALLPLHTKWWEMTVGNVESAAHLWKPTLLLHVPYVRGRLTY